jgi:hypothetical protein
MNWTIHVAKPALKNLARAPAKSQRLIRAALLEMQQNPFTGDIVRLTAERQHIDVVAIDRRTSTTY